MAKTQYSLSDNPSLLGRPENFDITVREVRVSNGAGFIVVLTGMLWQCQVYLKFLLLIEWI